MAGASETPWAVIEAALAAAPLGPNRDPVELLPPLGERERAALDGRLRLPAPAEIAEVLARARGVRVGIDEVRFDVIAEPSFLGDLLPESALLVDNDGAGNVWLAPIDPRTGAWGPVVFACHDPPVIGVEARTIAEFLRLLVASYAEPDSVLIGVDGPACDAWTQALPPTSLARSTATGGPYRGVGDPALADFIATLPSDAVVVDLRDAARGIGFPWSIRYEVLRRHPTELLFALRRRRGLFTRLFGR
jgi:hypothetical protein